MKRIYGVILSILILFGLASEIFACTTFCLKSKGEVLFGKNYDWMIGDGLVFVNKRGVSKVSMVENSSNPAKWVSQYGSVTFNQYGRENPMGGMNEAGLVIELMWLDETKYPKADSRPALDTLEWIQYQLDTAATVEEVLKNAQTVRIASQITLHYLVNDKNGNSATVEFLDGNMVAHTGEKLTVSALANDTYEKSLNYFKRAENAKSESSLDRFTRAAQRAKEFEKQPRSEQQAVSYAFEILANVAQKNSTQWSIVYDQGRGKIYFRSMQSPTIKTIDTKFFDYSCGTAIKIFDINAKTSGDVTAKFTDYTREANRHLIERSFKGTPFLKDVPVMAKDFYASYAENFACDVKSKTAELQREDNSKDVDISYYLTVAASACLSLFSYLFG